MQHSVSLPTVTKIRTAASPLRNGGPVALARTVKVLAWGVPSHTMGWSGLPKP
jgi:hypothetical protein